MRSNLCISPLCLFRLIFIFTASILPFTYQNAAAVKTTAAIEAIIFFCAIISIFPPNVEINKLDCARSAAMYPQGMICFTLSSICGVTYSVNVFIIIFG